jgi:hypothetical protein
MGSHGSYLHLAPPLTDQELSPQQVLVLRLRGSSIFFAKDGRDADPRWVAGMLTQRGPGGAARPPRPRDCIGFLCGIPTHLVAVTPG